MLIRRARIFVNVLPANCNSYQTCDVSSIELTVNVNTPCNNKTGDFQAYINIIQFRLVSKTDCFLFFKLI